jgi:HK97 family phage major capsid protein
MAFTKRSDVVIPEILIDAIQGEFAGKRLLYSTGAVVSNDSLPGEKRGGDTVTIPYFGTLGEADDILNEGDALTPEGINETKETATVIHSGKAFEATEWARMAAAGDPYVEAARQLRIIMERRFDKALIDVATSALPSTYVNDVTGTPGQQLTYDVVADSTGLWGDQQENIVLIGVHSKVYRDLLKLKDSTGRNLLTMPSYGPDGFKPAQIYGVPVVVSDKCKVIAGTPNKYETLLIKSSALALWMQAAPKVMTGNDILADTSLVATHFYFATHRYKRVRGSTHPGIVKIVTF